MRRLQTVFCGKGGRLRCGWLLALGGALDLAWAYAVFAGLTRVFSGLFAVWGITSANLSRAPGWAQWLVRSHGSVISLVTSLGVVALSLGLLRLTGAKRPRGGIRGGTLAVGAGIGLAVVLASAGLFVLIDSMRPAFPLAEARFGGELIALFIVYLAAALAEELFDRAFVLRAVDPAGGSGKRRLLSWAASAAALWLTTGALGLGVLGSINMLLFGLLLALLHDLGRPELSLGLRFGWSYASVALVNFPGGNTASRPLWQLNHVSESLLTGGDRGLICGLWMTALLALALLAIFLRMGKANKEG